MRITALGLFALFLALTCACATESAEREPDSSKPLVVASDFDNPPFAQLDEHDKAHGRDVEMMEQIAAALHRSIEWRRMPFAELLPTLAQGGSDIDVICATLGITPQRARFVAFSVPYFETEIAVVARSGEGEPRSFAELDGKKVAAGLGTTSERALLQRLPRAVAVLQNKNQLPLHDRLNSREVDAAVLDAPSAEALIAKGGGALTRLPGNLGAESYALALSKAKSELLAAINRELLGMEQSGELRRLDAAYGVQQRATPAEAAGDR